MGRADSGRNQCVSWLEAVRLQVFTRAVNVRNHEQIRDKCLHALSMQMLKRISEGNVQEW